MTTYPTPAPPLPPAPPTAPKRRGGALKAGVVGVAGLILGLILGSTMHSASPAAEQPAPTVAAASAAPVEAAPATQAQAQPAAPAATAAPGPAGSFGDGTFTVPDQIVAGSYQTDGKGDFGGCYWARLKDASGDFDTIITNGTISGPTTVTLRKTDGAFKTSGGCTWTKR